MYIKNLHKLKRQHILFSSLVLSVGTKVIQQIHLLQITVCARATVKVKVTTAMLYVVIKETVMRSLILAYAMMVQATMQMDSGEISVRN